jgi:hypothetical protein
MNCHFDSIFFWWMNCHFCSIGSSFFIDALLFWLQLSLGMNCHFERFFCMDELPFLLNGFSFWIHLFYGLMAVLAPSFLSMIINLAISQKLKKIILFILETQEGVSFPFYEKDQS